MILTFLVLSVPDWAVIFAVDFFGNRHPRFGVADVNLALTLILHNISSVCRFLETEESAELTVKWAHKPDRSPYGFHRFGLQPSAQ